MLLTIYWIRIVGQAENRDTRDSGLREVLQQLTVKPTHYKRQYDPRNNDLFDSKYNPVAECSKEAIEWSEEAFETAALVKFKDCLFNGIIKNVSGITLEIYLKISVTNLL